MALKSKSLDAVRPDVPVAVAAKEDAVRINFVVPASVRRRWKAAAVDADITLTDLLVQAMCEKLGRMSK